jgi:hypothetical protein
MEDEPDGHQMLKDAPDELRVARAIVIGTGNLRYKFFPLF